MEGTGGESARSISRRCQATNIHHQVLSQPPRLTPRSVTPENRRHLRHPIHRAGGFSLSLSPSWLRDVPSIPAIVVARCTPRCSVLHSEAPPVVATRFAFVLPPPPPMMRFAADRIGG